MAEMKCGTSDLVAKYSGQDESLNITADSLREHSLVQTKAVRESDVNTPCPGSEECDENGRRKMGKAPWSNISFQMASVQVRTKWLHIGTNRGKPERGGQ